MTDAPEPQPASQPPAKLSWRERLQEYGSIGIVTYFVVFGITVVGFYVAIKSGVEVDGVVGESSTWFAAWVATKLTQPIRIAVVLALTPFVAMVWHRVRGRALPGVPKPPAITGTDVDTRPDP